MHWLGKIKQTVFKILSTILSKCSWQGSMMILARVHPQTQSNNNFVFTLTFDIFAWG